MKNSLNATVAKTANPFKHLWDKYVQGTITSQDLQQETRGWMLNRISHYQYQEMPPLPRKRTKQNMEGWVNACMQRSLENSANRHHLSILLRDLQKGRLVAVPGKKEEIQVLLEEYPHFSRR